jgi:TM2 domain-containing membrane protein YozV
MLTTQDRILIEQRVANAKPSLGAAYVLGIFLGMFGAHRFYLGYMRSGLTMLVLTCLIVGIPITFIWHIVDWFLIPGMVREKTDELRRELTDQAMAEAPMA